MKRETSSSRIVALKFKCYNHIQVIGDAHFIPVSAQSREARVSIAKCTCTFCGCASGVM